jgi:hypothetical protein
MTKRADIPVCGCCGPVTRMAECGELLIRRQRLEQKPVDKDGQSNECGGSAGARVAREPEADDRGAMPRP